MTSGHGYSSSYLHLKLVKEHRFKVGGEYGKDPRSFVNREIKYKKIDERRKHKREVLLDDYNDILKTPDPAPSIEDSVIEKISLADPEKEFLPLRMVRDEGMRALIKTTFLDELPLDSVQEDLGITPKDDTVRQQFSRVRKDAAAQRDALFTYLLIMGRFPLNGEMPQFPKNPELAEWADLVIRSVRPGVWLNGVAADGKSYGAVQSLTRRFNGAPAHLYLVAIHKEYISALYSAYIETRPFHNGRGRFFEPRFDLLTLDNQGCLKYVDKLINPKSRELCQSHYMYSLLDSYPTEVSGLNSALTDIRGDYGIWLLSNSVPDSSRIHGWTYGKSAGEISLRERKQRDVKLTKLYSRCLLSPSRISSMILTPR